MAPFLVSATGVGYEQHAYVWTGFGVWTQLWAQWTLPLAWGFGWRAIRDGRGYLRAVLLTALTVALHFETGYLALSVLLVWPLAAGRPLAARLRRAAILLGGSLLASAWVIVPLLAQREWAATNEIVRGTALENGYGARRVLDWLVSGGLLDHGRLPVVTVFAALGFGLAWLAWSSDVDARALVVALAVCLLFAFGRTTFGSLADLIPGSADLFFRRFMMGAQLAALLLAGRGAAWVAAGGVRLLEARVPRWPPGLSPAVLLAGAIVMLAPAWVQLGAYDRHDGAAIQAQRRADDTRGAELDRLVAVIERDGGGRTYAGMPSNWGQDFTVGAVPVFKYLESRDVDEVGYTLRTASLMTDPEYYFAERNPGDYRLFGIHYLIIPAGSRPPVPARLELRAGPYSLWTLPGAAGVLDAGTIVGTLSADRRHRHAQHPPAELAARARPRLPSRRVRTARWPRTPATATVARDAGRHGLRGVRQAATGTGGGPRADAPGRSRRAQRIVRPRLDGDRRRTVAAHRDGRACARRHDRPQRHAPNCLPLPRMAGLPTPVRGRRSHSGRTCLHGHQTGAIPRHRPHTLIPSSRTCPFRSCAGQEGVDVGGELGVVLEEEAVRRVRVDLQTRVGDEAGQQIGVAREDHRVAVAVGHEHGLVDRRDPLEQGVVWLSPGAYRVVLRQPGLPAGRRVAVDRARPVDPAEDLLVPPRGSPPSR